MEDINMLNDFNPGALEHRKIPDPGMESVVGAELAELAWNGIETTVFDAHTPFTMNELPIVYISEGIALAVHMDELHMLVGKYVHMIETETTNKLCKCEWIVHPDDADKPEGKRKIRRGEAALNCPVHTKEGFLLGFFDFVVSEPQGIQAAND